MSSQDAPTTKPEIDRLNLDGINHLATRFGVGKPCVVTLQCNRKIFNVELMPVGVPADSVLLRYGFDPGPFLSQFSSGPGPFPDYNPPDAIEARYLAALDRAFSGNGTLNDIGHRAFTQIYSLILILTTGEQIIRGLAGPTNELAEAET